eukprot:5340399-Lingulodinium_polyedra.AAC.1
MGIGCTFFVIGLIIVDLWHPGHCNVAESQCGRCRRGRQMSRCRCRPKRTNTWNHALPNSNPRRHA